MNYLCATCLSADRRLFNLECTIITGFNFQFGKKDKVCWECKRFLTRIQNFKEQAIKAQTLLKSQAMLPYPVACLSSLAVYHKDTYDEICFHSPPTIESVTIKVEPADWDDVQDESEDTNIDHTQLDTKPSNYDVKPDLELLTRTVPVHFDTPTGSCENVTENSFNYDVKEAQKVTVKVEVIEHAASSCQQVNPQGSDGATKDATESELYSRQRNYKTIHYTKNITEEEMLKARHHQMSQKRYIRNQYKCELCILGFTSEKNLNRHKENKHSETSGNFMCKVCTQRFKREADAREHYLDHYRFYRCRDCEYSHPKLEIVEAHYEAKHETERVYPCLKCDQTFLTRRKKKTHVQAVHRSPVCPHCNKNFSSASNLKKHLLTHANLPKLECPDCHKLYKTEDTLREHRKSHEPAPPPPEDAYCADCDLHFSSRLRLASHLRYSSRHLAPEALRFECDHCGKKFTRKYVIAYHMEREHLRVLKYACELCPRKYASNTQLRKHINKVHKKKMIDQRTACNVCGKVYANPCSCRKHQRSHSGELPHHCRLCIKRFTHRSVLRRHLQAVHKVDPDTLL